MDWVSLIAGLFGSSGSGGGGMSGGWFSTATPSEATGGTIVQNFGDSRPVYNQSALASLEDLDPVKLAVAGVVVFALVMAWRKR